MGSFASLTPSRLPELLLACSAITLLLVLSPRSAGAAASFMLDIEFDDGTLGSYATVQVDENAGDLDFQIDLNLANPLLGADADLHELYFNLVGSFTGLMLTADDAPNNPYSLIGPDPSIGGGAGSSFDWGVNFGNGAGPSGNGTLQSAMFTLSANEALAIADLLELSSTSQMIMVHMAAHIQSTASQPGSETVGGTVPEPGTVQLLALGLAAGAARARRRA